jgi:hypothetical protein
MERPKQGKEVVTSVRLPAEMVEWIEAHATENVRSRAQEIEFLLKQAMRLMKEREGETTQEGDRSTKQVAG